MGSLPGLLLLPSLELELSSDAWILERHGWALKIHHCPTPVRVLEDITTRAVSPRPHLLVPECLPDSVEVSATIAPDTSLQHH